MSGQASRIEAILLFGFSIPVASKNEQSIAVLAGACSRRSRGSDTQSGHLRHSGAHRRVSGNVRLLAPPAYLATNGGSGPFYGMVSPGSGRGGASDPAPHDSASDR